MLTRQQLQRMAQRERIGLHAQERDYLQHVLLALVYARTQTLIFKGGTALRIVHRGGRYSEDLDFSLVEVNEGFNLQPYLDGIENEFKSLGVTVTVKRKEKTVFFLRATSESSPRQRQSSRP